MEKIVALTGTKQRHPETVIRSKERSREKKNVVSQVTINLIEQQIEIFDRYLEELNAFEAFIKELRRIGERPRAVGIEDFSSWGTSLPSDAEKIAEEIVYIKTLAGIHNVGIEKSCGNILQDLSNLAENLDHNIVAIRSCFQRQRIATIERLSALTGGTGEIKIPRKEISKLKIIPSCKTTSVINYEICEGVKYEK